jgi:hypothetical protein
MKKEDMLLLAAAGVAAFLILKSGGIATLQKTAVANTSGLSYTPAAGYGDTARYDWYAPQAVVNGGWGIE